MSQGSERFLGHLADLAEESRFTDALSDMLQVSPLQLLDTYLSLLEAGLVEQIQVREPGRLFRTRLDVTPKGRRYLEQVRVRPQALEPRASRSGRRRSPEGMA